MTKHSMVTLRLHRNGVILAIVFGLLFAILIFVAGYLFGTRRPGIPVPKAPPPVAKASAPVTSTAPAAPEKPVAIRVGMFPAEADAKALVQRLAAQKVVATVAPLPTDTGATLYLVLVGRYTNRGDAAAAAAELTREHELATAVVPIE